MVTKRQQLEFAAKHIKKWKSGYDYAVVEETTDGHLYVRWPSICTSGITKKDWQQERDKMQKQAVQPAQDNSWHERGELPPVGCECYIRHSCWNSEKYEKVTVAAITNEYVIVKYATFEQHYMLKDISFRPIRTEREKAIDAACDIICKNGVHDFEREVITKLYDAGILK